MSASSPRAVRTMTNGSMSDARRRRHTPMPSGPAGPEAEVEEHELVALGRQRVERRLAVGHRADVVALGEQGAGQDVPEVVVVLDEQDARAHGGAAR